MLPRELKLDSTFTEKFFTLPPDVSNTETIVKFPLPGPDVKQFNAFVKKQGKSKFRFNKKKTFWWGVNELLNKLEDWCEANLEVSFSITAALSPVRVFYGYSGDYDNDAFITKLLTLFRNGTPYLLGIVNYIYNEKIPLSFRKDVTTQLLYAFSKNICAEGCQLNLYQAYLQIHSNFATQLLRYRKEVSEQVMCELLKENHIVDNNGYGMEIHYSELPGVYYGDELGTGKEEALDLYSRPVIHILNSFDQPHAESVSMVVARIVKNLFPARFTKALMPESLIERLYDFIIPVSYLTDQDVEADKSPSLSTALNKLQNQTQLTYQEADQLVNDFNAKLEYFGPVPLKFNELIEEIDEEKTEEIHYKVLPKKTLRNNLDINLLMNGQALNFLRLPESAMRIQNIFPGVNFVFPSDHVSLCFFENKATKDATHLATFMDMQILALGAKECFKTFLSKIPDTHLCQVSMLLLDYLETINDKKSLTDEIAKAFEECDSLIKTLLKSECLILKWAVTYNQIPLVKRILAEPSNMYIKKMLSFLEIASINKNWELVRILLGSAKDIEVTTAKLEPIILRMIRNEEFATFNFLLSLDYIVDENERDEVKEITYAYTADAQYTKFRTLAYLLVTDVSDSALIIKLMNETSAYFSENLKNDRNAFYHIITHKDTAVLTALLEKLYNIYPLTEMNINYMVSLFSRAPDGTQRLIALISSKYVDKYSEDFIFNLLIGIKYKWQTNKIDWVALSEFINVKFADNKEKLKHYYSFENGINYLLIKNNSTFLETTLTLLTSKEITVEPLVESFKLSIKLYNSWQCWSVLNTFYPNSFNDKDLMLHAAEDGNAAIASGIVRLPEHACLEKYVSACPVELVTDIKQTINCLLIILESCSYDEIPKYSDSINSLLASLLSPGFENFPLLSPQIFRLLLHPNLCAKWIKRVLNVDKCQPDFVQHTVFAFKEYKEDDSKLIGVMHLLMSSSALLKKVYEKLAPIEQAYLIQKSLSCLREKFINVFSWEIFDVLAAVLKLHNEHTYDGFDIASINLNITYIFGLLYDANFKDKVVVLINKLEGPATQQFLPKDLNLRKMDSTQYFCISTQILLKMPFIDDVQQRIFFNTPAFLINAFAKLACKKPEVMELLASALYANNGFALKWLTRMSDKRLSLVLKNPLMQEKISGLISANLLIEPSKFFAILFERSIESLNKTYFIWLNHLIGGGAYTTEISSLRALRYLIFIIHEKFLDTPVIHQTDFPKLFDILTNAVNYALYNENKKRMKLFLKICDALNKNLFHSEVTTQLAMLKSKIYLKQFAKHYTLPMNAPAALDYFPLDKATTSEKLSLYYYLTYFHAHDAEKQKQAINLLSIYLSETGCEVAFNLLCARLTEILKTPVIDMHYSFFVKKAIEQLDSNDLATQLFTNLTTQLAKETIPSRAGTYAKFLLFSEDKKCLSQRLVTKYAVLLSTTKNIFLQKLLIVNLWNEADTHLENTLRRLANASPLENIGAIIFADVKKHFTKELNIPEERFMNFKNNFAEACQTQANDFVAKMNLTGSGLTI